jgi:hypothetical protein
MDPLTMLVLSVASLVVLDLATLSLHAPRRSARRRDR